MPRDGESLARDIEESLRVPREEAERYIAALGAGAWTPSGPRERATAEALRGRGMMILDANGGAYLPVHPRLALSNLFRAYEEKAAMERKAMRLLVDRLTLELINLAAGETKGKKASGPGVGRTSK